MGQKPFLHVYAQHYQCGGAHIVGDKEALIKLRDALNVAIDRQWMVDGNSFLKSWKNLEKVKYLI